MKKLQDPVPNMLNLDLVNDVTRPKKASQKARPVEVTPPTEIKKPVQEAPPAPPDVTSRSKMEVFQRTRFSAEEIELNNAFILALTKATGLKVTASEVTRAFWALLRACQNDVVAQAAKGKTSKGKKKTRPSYGDQQGQLDYEKALRALIFNGLKRGETSTTDQ